MRWGTRHESVFYAAARPSAVLLCLLLSTSCISTWSEFPRGRRSSRAEPISQQTLYYQIGEVSGMFGGGEALREAFRDKAPFPSVEALSEPPERGLFCRIDAERRAPNVASGVAAYVSYALLFTIPFWSSEGYRVRYHVYVDGQERKILEYDITRKSFFWIVVLPVSWVSLLTPSERDAFEGTVDQFFLDLEPYVRGTVDWAR